MWFDDIKSYLYVPSSLCIFSLPFPAEDNEEGGGDGDRGASGPWGMGKGLSREQEEGLDMMKHIMLSLDEEDGLDEIYTFRLEGTHGTLDIFYVSLLLNMFFFPLK